MLIQYNEECFICPVRNIIVTVFKYQLLLFLICFSLWLKTLFFDKLLIKLMTVTLRYNLIIIVL